MKPIEWPLQLIKILEHFTPKFLLGMTATPERMDKQNIYEVFDYHLAYELG